MLPKTTILMENAMNKQDGVSKFEQKRVLWQCRRGMLELDLFLMPFVEKHYIDLSSEERAIFNDLLETPDPILYAWLIKKEDPDNPTWSSLVERIRCVI